jgi:hypothetical protein
LKFNTGFMRPSISKLTLFPGSITSGPDWQKTFPAEVPL